MPPARDVFPKDPRHSASFHRLYHVNVSTKRSVKSHPSDLAIHGGQRAFSSPIHVGLPNLAGRDAFLRYAGEAFDRRWVTNDGPLVQEFERRVAERLGVANCVAMTNGTVAMQVAAKAAGLTGEVIVPSYTFIATAHAFEWIGLSPVFADIDSETHNLDPRSVESVIGPRTSAVIPVHLWGRPAPIDDLTDLAGRHGLKLMFDAAHAFGSSYRGLTIGCFGNAEVLSFHATKFMNSLEGGAVVTDDDEMAERMRKMRNFGFAGFDNVVSAGTNAKMHEISAAMGLASLDQVDDLIQKNQATYFAYQKALKNVVGVRLLEHREADTPNYQYVVVEVDDEHVGQRDQCVAALHAENVMARKYFWPGCHGMAPYRDRDQSSRPPLPHTEAVSERVIVLPTGPSVSIEAIDVIASVIGLSLST